MNVKLKVLLSAVAMSFVMVGCGGGGGGDGSGPSGPTLNPNGLWYGTQVFNNREYDAQYIIYNNEVYGYSLDAQALSSGAGTISGNQLSANYNIYDTNTGYQVTSGSITGTVVEESTIVGKFSTNDGQNGTVNLRFNHAYNNDSNISLIKGNRAGIIIDSSGTISGSYSSCTVNGKVVIPDSSINIYEVKYSLTSCSIQGNYTGIGSVLNQSGRDVFVAGMVGNLTMHRLSLNL